MNYYRVINPVFLLGVITKSGWLGCSAEDAAPLVESGSLVFDPEVTAQSKTEMDKFAADQAEADRVAKEAADKAEADRVAKEAADKAEADRIAKEAADKAEADRIAKEAADKKAAATTSKKAAK